MSAIAKNASLGCLRSLVLPLLVAVVIVPLGCLLILVPMWLVMNFDLNIVWLIVPTILFLVIVFGGLAMLGFWVIYRRGRKLDAAFVPLGLSGSRYLLWFRQYHGTVNGRQVDVYLKQGPYFDVYVGTPVKTRLGVAGQQWDTRIMGALLGRPPLAFADPRLSGLSVFAWEEEWTRDVMARPNVAELLRRLIDPGGFWIRRQVILSPGALRLSLSGSTTLFRFEIRPEEAHQWLGDLVALAEIVERAPGPQNPLEESGGEQLARSVRSQNSYLLPIVTVIALLGMLFCAVGAGVAAYLFAMASNP